MKILDTLQNPFALIAQGFVAGAIIILATMPPESDTPRAAPTAAAAPAQEISQA